MPSNNDNSEDKKIQRLLRDRVYQEMLDSGEAKVRAKDGAITDLSGRELDYYPLDWLVDV